MHAASTGKLKLAKILLDAGADVLERDKNGWTAEDFARIGNSPELISLLKQYSSGLTPTQTVPPKQVDPAINNKLITAAKSGSEYRVSRLLTQGADPNARNSNGHTALMMASVYGHLEVVTTLLKSGADKNLKSTSGSTALDFAKLYNNTSLFDYLR
jgi:ankyrin repeat protein